MAATETQMKLNMERMYRWTRHVYDITRKYFLLGRDRSLEGMNVKAGEIICEVGCGTARNLIKLARREPEAIYTGVDISDSMLETARASLHKKELGNAVSLAQGYAQSFNPEKLFTLPRPPDKILFSYALSIIPPWQESIDHAVSLLEKDGEIHIIDFGGMEGQSKPVRAFLFWWLGLFHVYHRPEIKAHLEKLQTDGKGLLHIEDYYGGYCYRAVFKKA